MAGKKQQSDTYILLDSDDSIMETDLHEKQEAEATAQEYAVQGNGDVRIFKLVGTAVVATTVVPA